MKLSNSSPSDCWQKDRALFQPQENPPCYQVKGCTSLIMNPDNNHERKWERLFLTSCKTHLPCTQLLLQLSKHVGLHSNGPIATPGSGVSAALLAHSPLTCTLSNHHLGIQLSSPKPGWEWKFRLSPRKGQLESQLYIIAFERFNTC